MNENILLVHFGVDVYVHYDQGSLCKYNPQM